MITRYKSGSQLVGLIYMHRLTDRRFTGIAGRNFRIFRELCGETSLKNVVLVTNMWNEVSRYVGEAREKELASDFLKPALDKGAKMVRTVGGMATAEFRARPTAKRVPGHVTCRAAASAAEVRQCF